MTDVLSFTIPGPIVPWQRAIPLGEDGPRRAVNTKKHRAYAALVRSCGHTAVLLHARGRWPLDGVRYELALRFFFQDLRTRDDDNCEKAIKDGLKRVLWSDDAWTRFASVTKTMELDRANPRVELEVRVVPALDVPVVTAARRGRGTARRATR